MIWSCTSIFDGFACTEHCNIFASCKGYEYDLVHTEVYRLGRVFEKEWPGLKPIFVFGKVECGADKNWAHLYYINKRDQLLESPKIILLIQYTWCTWKSKFSHFDWLHHLKKKYMYDNF